MLKSSQCHAGHNQPLKIWLMSRMARLPVGEPVGICIRHMIRHTGSAAEASRAASWEALLCTGPLQPSGNAAPRTGVTQRKVLLQKESGSLLVEQMLNIWLEYCSNNPALQSPFHLYSILMPAKAQARLPKHSIDFWSINWGNASFKISRLLTSSGAALGGEWFTPSFPLSSPSKVFPACAGQWFKTQVLG